MSIRDAIQTKLQSLSGLTALVGTRTFWQRMTQGATLPAVVYRLRSAQRASAMGSDTGMVLSRWQFIALGDTITDCEGVAIELRSGLKRLSDVTISSVVIDSTFLEDESDVEFDDSVDVHGIVLDFTINYRE